MSRRPSSPRRHLERLAEVAAPTLVLSGALDVDAIDRAATEVLTRVSGARQVVWSDTAHLPSMERPDAFCTLLLDWLAEAEAEHGSRQGRR